MTTDTVELSEERLRELIEDNEGLSGQGEVWASEVQKMARELLSRRSGTLPSGADRIAAMTAEEFNRDRSHENPNVGKHARLLTSPVKEEPVAWRPHDLIEDRSYESRRFGVVVYRGIDTFYGDKTFAFDVGRGDMRYTKDLNDFLAPRGAASPAPNTVPGAPSVEVMGWQPIETAPKMPSEILLWGVLKGRTQPWKYIGSWFSHRDGGWWVAHALPIKPTYWAPLLPAPAALAPHGKES